MLGVVGLIERATAVVAALVVGIVALFAYGLVIARQEDMGWPRALLNATVAGLFGLATLPWDPNSVKSGWIGVANVDTCGRFSDADLRIHRVGSALQLTPRFAGGKGRRFESCQSCGPPRR